MSNGVTSGGGAKQKFGRGHSGSLFQHLNKKMIRSIETEMWVVTGVASRRFEVAMATQSPS